MYLPSQQQNTMDLWVNMLSVQWYCLDNIFPVLLSRSMWCLQLQPHSIHEGFVNYTSDHLILFSGRKC